MALTRFPIFNHQFVALEKVEAKQYCCIRVMVWSEDIIHG